MKPWLKVVFAVVGLLTIVVVGLAMFVNANTFRPPLETQLTTALGRPVKLGNLSLSLFSGRLVADDLSIAGDPKYSTRPFLTAKQLKIGVEMSPLIFSRELHVRSFQAIEPQIDLVRAADGTWNFSSLGQGPARTQAGSKTPALSNLEIGLISVQDGRAVVESTPPNGLPRTYDHLTVTVHNFSFAKPFPFTISANLPAEGVVNVTGTAGPINQQDAAMTAADVQLSIKHLDPVAAGFLDAQSGLSMLADITAHAVSNGVTVTSQGTINAQRLILLKGGSPAPKPVDLSYTLAHSLKDNRGQLQDLAVKTGNVAAHVTGTYQLGGDAPVVGLKLIGKSLPIDELQSLMPAVGVKLPNGSVLRGGTLSTTLDITGPTKDTLITGPLELNDTHLNGFNLGAKVSGLAAMGGVQTGDVTSIQTLRTTLRVTSPAVQANSIYALLPALGEATGDGTVASGGALDFKMSIKLNTSQGIGKGATGLLTAVNGVAGNVATAAIKNGVPMTITGTASNPVIAVDLKGVLQKNAASVVAGQLLGGSQGQKAVDVLGSLFGKKKK